MEAYWQDGLAHAFCVSTSQSEQLAQLLAPVVRRAAGLEAEEMAAAAAEDDAAAAATAPRSSL